MVYKLWVIEIWIFINLCDLLAKLCRLTRSMGSNSKEITFSTLVKIRWVIMSLVPLLSTVVNIILSRWIDFITVCPHEITDLSTRYLLVLKVMKYLLYGLPQYLAIAYSILALIFIGGSRSNSPSPLLLLVIWVCSKLGLNQHLSLTSSSLTYSSRPLFKWSLEGIFWWIIIWHACLFNSIIW